LGKQARLNEILFRPHLDFVVQEFLQASKARFLWGRPFTSARTGRKGWRFRETEASGGEDVDDAVGSNGPGDDLADGSVEVFFIAAPGGNGFGERGADGLKEATSSRTAMALS